MNPSSFRHGLAAAGLVLCLGLAACGGGGGGDSASGPSVPGETPAVGNPPPPGGDQPTTPALKCAP